MIARNISENESENKSVRIHYLEQQVRMMRNELRHIRKDLVPQEDLRRLRHLSEKLNELNTLLYELRLNYKSLQQPKNLKQAETSLRNNNSLKQTLPRHQLRGKERKFQDVEDETINNYQEKRYVNNLNSSHCRRQEVRHLQPMQEQVGEKDPLINRINQYDQQKLNEAEEYIQEPNNENMEKDSPELDKNTAFKSCKQFMDEIRPPGSILGNYLLRLQDFRTDPELRRRRLEKKQHEKSMQKQKQNKEMETKIFNEANETMGHSSKENVKQSETPTSECRIIEWDNTPIPPEEPPTPTSVSPAQTTDYVNIPVKTQTFTTETQTDEDDMTRNGEADRKNKATDCPKPQFTSTTQLSSSEETDSNSSLSKKLPLIHKNLRDVVYSIVQNIDPDIVALTVVLETDNLYHINISITTTGQSLSCLYATEAAIQQAKIQNLFKNFLTFFVVNSEHTLGQKDLMLGHSFEFKTRET